MPSGWQLRRPSSVRPRERRPAEAAAGKWTVPIWLSSQIIVLGKGRGTATHWRLTGIIGSAIRARKRGTGSPLRWTRRPERRRRPAMADGKPPLTLLIAAPRGFCAGVDRAIRIVEDRKSTRLN